MSSCEFHELNLGQTCFFLMSFIPTLLLVPCWIVAKFIHEPAIKKAQKESLPPVPIPFTGRYPLSEAAHKTDNLDKLDKCVVLAGTPDGYVCGTVQLRKALSTGRIKVSSTTILRS